MRIGPFALASILPLILAASAMAGDAPITTPHSTPNPAIDGKGAFATGKYRNLFAELGHPQAEIDAKIAKAFNQLFHGDKDTQTVYYESGKNDDGPYGYVTDIVNRDVRSEGMSYGMMIAVQMDKKAEFDALWNWARTFTYYKDPASPNHGYFAWTAQTSGRHNNPGPACDGEEYYTMALYFAAHRWPGGKGIYDYKACADQLLSDMLHHYPAGTNQPANPPAAGRGGRGGGAANNMFELNSKMVRFVPGAGNTDPSYHLPHYYELWARWGPEADRDFWLAAATASRDLYYKVANKNTGLCPDQCSFDGVAPRGAATGTSSGNFQADAWRCASNWSVDYSWFAKDPREQELSDRLQAFFASKGMDKYADRLQLDGTTVRDTHKPGLVFTNAVASLAAKDPRAKDFVEALWNGQIPEGQTRYYDGMLYMMSLLHCSGQFRIW
jgi:oligosaccharide reducing-end xylanase